MEEEEREEGRLLRRYVLRTNLSDIWCVAWWERMRLWPKVLRLNGSHFFAKFLIGYAIHCCAEGRFAVFPGMLAK